jgi:hypothetical protein
MVDVRPMTEEYIHIDCLHHGPVDPARAPSRGKLYQTVENLPRHPWTDDTIVEMAQRYYHLSEGWRGDPAREFMREMIQRYGTCAMLAWQEGKVVGQLRFYPIKMAQLVYNADPKKQSLMGEAGGLAFEAESDTLWVQCVMTARPYKNATGALWAGARRGVGQLLIRALVTWGIEHRWQRIVKQAHADLDCMYGQYGGGGKGFWEKAGFTAVGTLESGPHHNKEWRQTVEREADAKGMSRKEAWRWFLMAYDLAAS